MTRHTIKFAGQPVGIVVAEENSFKFIAVKYPVWELDKHQFTSVEAAQEAVKQLLSGRTSGIPRSAVAATAELPQRLSA
ncbi:hypothetical protein IFT84_02465 [Rhizobium sp. CFBP 8762]|uniref:hypothetical protein n=1 Tax=Rhizobium sp. CFBP 8762 TaxID=2775279 RepID=UPI00178727D5|nr:hypothetical protein [Rhizobium sp. CFBP 8762]MBD8553383.1 hypothetical protein [Rhizobium sp. CFBP 8762]